MEILLWACGGIVVLFGVLGVFAVLRSMQLGGDGQ